MGKLPRQTSRNDLIRRMRELGWEGPFKDRGKHSEIMLKDTVRQKLPNVHRGDISQVLLIRVLDQANISRLEWLGEEEDDDTEQQSEDTKN